MLLIKEKGRNEQLAINMAASFMTFVVGLGIRFFLTPYIVKTLGPEAYGFIGLSANILSYTGLITIALNSMAGRFVTIKYSAGEIEEANRYFTSVFYSNLILGGILLLASAGCVVWLEYIIEIPEDLIFDVKFLFCLLSVNNILGLLTGIWGVATFIKNRLDLSNVRGIIGNFMNAATLVILFTFFSPHIWFMGVAGMVLTIYGAVTNRTFSRMLTPDLLVKRDYFEWQKVKELLMSGVWNLISKLGEILGQGMDLLIANLCIGATAMGYFALTKNVPFLILSLFQTISAVFSPVLTNLYAQGKTGELVKEFNKSIRILCFFTAIPLSLLYCYGDYFYGLWLPTEDSSKLQLLTVLGTFALPYTMPLESLWNIFTITNKLKYSTLFMLGNNIVVFVIVMTSMFIVDSLEIRLLILASTRSLCGLIRGFVFLPMYGAYCLELPVKTFYGTIFKSLLCTTACIFFCYLTRFFMHADSWGMLFLATLITLCICFALSSVLILTSNDRKVIYTKILSKRR